MAYYDDLPKLFPRPVLPAAHETAFLGLPPERVYQQTLWRSTFLIEAGGQRHREGGFSPSCSASSPWAPRYGSSVDDVPHGLPTPTVPPKIGSLPPLSPNGLDSLAPFDEAPFETTMQPREEKNTKTKNGRKRKREKGDATDTKVGKKPKKKKREIWLGAAAEILEALKNSPEGKATCKTLARLCKRPYQKVRGNVRHLKKQKKIEHIGNVRVKEAGGRATILYMYKYIDNGANKIKQQSVDSSKEGSQDTKATTAEKISQPL